MSQTTDRVGVRELRQNLSVYLRRIKEGETLEVTEHGHAVARLTPIPRQELSPLERLIADGRVTPPQGDLMDIVRNLPPVAPLEGPSLTEVLLRMREEERDT